MFGSFVLLSLLFVMVIIHEAGHLVLAKKYGVKVNTFSIGFGPRLIGVKFLCGMVSYRFFNFVPSNRLIWDNAETEYRIAPFPFGGFCSMEGEVKGESERSLSNIPYWQKVAVAIGGVIANMVTGFTAISALTISKLGFVKGVQSACYAVVSMAQESYTQTVNLITGKAPLHHWNEIADTSAQMVSFEGLVLQFGFFSIILALFNLIPFPALDGSLPFLWGLEYIFGKKTGEKIANVLVTVGFLLLMGLQIGIVIYWVLPLLNGLIK